MGDDRLDWIQDERESFNPRPRTVGDASSSAGRAAGMVSTHAHARWATRHRLPGRALWDVFQPTPTHGGRRFLIWFRLISCDQFQPTPTHGGRHAGARDYAAHVGRFNPRPRTVGDHQDQWRLRRRKSFNPRPRTVGDGRRPETRESISVFQPTPTHGGRLRLNVKSSFERKFQPTPTHGGRQVGAAIRIPGGGFQPTPTHGGRLEFDEDVRAIARVSTHAHARWATSIVEQRGKNTRMFQPTPTHGGRPHSSVLLSMTRLFQPTPTHGGRPKDFVNGARFAMFQPTPTHGGRLCLPETLKNKEKIAIMRESVVKEK